MSKQWKSKEEISELRGAAEDLVKKITTEVGKEVKLAIWDRVGLAAALLGVGNDDRLSMCEMVAGGVLAQVVRIFITSALGKSERCEDKQETIEAFAELMERYAREIRSREFQGEFIREINEYSVRVYGKKAIRES